MAISLPLYSVPATGNKADVVLRPAPGGIGGFPTQEGGLFVFYGGVARELSMVAVGSGNAGNQLRIRKGTTTFCLYLVETTDPNASKVRVRTSTGTKAVRLRTP